MNQPIDSPNDQLQPTPDFTLDFRCDRIRQLHAYWRSKLDGRTMPRRADLDPVEIPRLLPHITLVGVEYDPFRLYYRLIGTHVTEAIGRDSTGLYFDEVYQEGMLAVMIGRFSTTVHARKPARFQARAAYADKDYRHYESVHLPMSEDGETVNMILAGAEFFR